MYVCQASDYDDTIDALSIKRNTNFRAFLFTMKEVIFTDGLQELASTPWEAQGTRRFLGDGEKESSFVL